MKKWIGIICLLYQTSLSAQLVCNEMMSYNESIAADIDGEFSDWIEIYNSGSESVELSAYLIGDDDFEDAWSFPEMSLAAGEYLLLYASGKNYKNPEAELHTNFKIKKEGEAIYLFHQNGSIVDHIPPRSLPKDISYARLPNASGDFDLCIEATPNAKNSGDQMLNVLKSSHGSGVYTSGFSFQLSDAKKHTIYYTLDGGVPNPGAFNTYLYTEAINIADRSNEENFISNIATTYYQYPHPYGWRMPQDKIRKGTVIRYCSYNASQQSSLLYTKTFFVFEEGKDAYDYPIVSLAVEHEDLFSEETGIYVPGIYEDLDVPDWTGNFFQRGMPWERPVHFTVLDEEGSFVFAQNAGLRIKGFGTRAAAQKSLKMYARKEYGDNHFFYDPFDRGMQRYSKLTLKTMFGSWAKIGFTDDMMDGILEGMDFNVLASTPSVVFINGEYWGVHNIRENFDEDYLYDHYGFSKEDISILTGDAVVEYGSNEDYLQMMDYVITNDLSDSIHYQKVANWMDIDNYIDYLVVETFFANRDWPHNNVKYWKTDSGKWKWHLYDLDAACVYDNVNYNMFQYLDSENPLEIPQYSNRLYKNLMESNVFRKRFFEKYFYHLEHSLQADVLIDRVKGMYHLYRNEMDEHIARWSSPGTKSEWENQVATVIRFLEERHVNVRRHLELFSMPLGETDNVSQNQFEPAVLLYPNPSTGRFFISTKGFERNEKFSVAIFNLLGDLQYSQDLYYDGVAIELKTNLGHGSYVLQLNSKKGLQRMSFIVLPN